MFQVLTGIPRECQTDRTIVNEHGTCSSVAVYQLLQKTNIYSKLHPEIRAVIDRATVSGTYGLQQCVELPSFVKLAYEKLSGKPFTVPKIPFHLLVSVVQGSPVLNGQVHTESGRIESLYSGLEAAAALCTRDTKWTFGTWRTEFPSPGNPKERNLADVGALLQVTRADPEIRGGWIGYIGLDAKAAHCVAFVMCKGDLVFYNNGFTLKEVGAHLKTISGRSEVCRFLFGKHDRAVFIDSVCVMWGEHAKSKRVEEGLHDVKSWIDRTLFNK
jgi:hypothetical protein